MKKLIFILSLIIVFFSCDAQNETTIVVGSVPIVITSSHGGKLRSSSVNNRNCEEVNCNSDLYTKEISIMLHNKLEGLMDEKSTLIINNWHRSELDVNRTEDLAYSDYRVKDDYDKYHFYINSILSNYTSGSEIVLLVDIHGHAHDHNMVELGYNIASQNYLLNSLNSLENCSLKSISKFNYDELITGNKGLGYLLQKRFETVPSNVNKIPQVGKYFNGGYTIEKYMTMKNVVTIQIEIPSKIRKSKLQRDVFTTVLAKSLKKFYNKIK